jgi:aminoglycoside phosphotransferase (APT) family kinase protein
MLPFIAEAVGLDPTKVTGLRCEPQVVTHKPGRRCVIRYALRASEPSRSRPPEPVFGKVYVSRRRATRMHDQHEALRRSGVSSMPACLMLVVPAHLVLQEAVEGTPLDRMLGSPDARGALVLAARWLASLHAAPPVADLKRVPTERSLEKACLWSSEVGRRVGSEAGDVGCLRSDLARLAATLPSRLEAVIHRDFQPAHVLCDQGRLWVLDFDELSLGDPALDVGHFLARLAFEGYRRSGRPGRFAELAEHFRVSYREATSDAVEGRLPFYRAYTFLKLADQHARHRPPDWRRCCTDLLELARRELPGTTPSSA